MQAVTHVQNKQLYHIGMQRFTESYFMMPVVILPAITIDTVTVTSCINTGTHKKLQSFYQDAGFEPEAADIKKQREVFCQTEPK